MKTFIRRIPNLPCTVTLLGILLASSVASGHGEEYDSWGWNWFGDLQVDNLQLTASTNAPSGSDAWASLLSFDDRSNNATFENLVVFTTGLYGGTYTVSITETTGSTEVVLGTFTSDVYEFDEYPYEHGDGWFELPSGITTADVATVTITDSQGNLIYSGEFGS